MSTAISSGTAASSAASRCHIGLRRRNAKMIRVTVDLPDTSVRTARSTDRERVLTIVREAFDQDRDPREEVELVEQVWSLPAYLPDLELVAEREGKVVGHVLHSRGDLDGRAVAALA